MPTGLLSQFLSQHNSLNTTEYRARRSEGSAEANSSRNRTSDPNDDLQGLGEDTGNSPSRRRLRSDSLESLTATSLYGQRELKRRKQFAASLCSAKGLPEDSLDDFVELSSTDMMISIRIEMLEMRMQGQKSAAQRFIESEEFKDILKGRLRTCLLSPNLTAYVVGLGDQIFAFAKRNLENFKIPEVAINDPEMSGKIIHLINNLLTSQRSNMKQKMQNHIASKGHISVLAKSLAPGGGYEITAAHWARIAFLRSSLAGYDAVVEKSRTQVAGDTDDGAAEQGSNSEEGSNQPKDRVWNPYEFWEYVDHVLHELRAASRQAESTPTGHAKYLEMFFTCCLQVDMRDYPGTESVPAMPAFDKVTVPFHKAVNSNLIWA